MARRAQKPRYVDPFDPLDGAVADKLDLHQYDRETARSRLGAFIATSRKRHPGELVHVITGKGRHSTGEPVLKPMVRRHLSDGNIHVFRWGADYEDGGFLIRLKGGRFK